jgi:putative transposase
VALEKTVEAMGNQIVFVNDNGSENFKEAMAYLEENGINQYFARPYTPKDKPHVENVISKYQKECLDYLKWDVDLEELESYTNEWLNEYHFHRPHQALGYKTPAQVAEYNGITIQREKVSHMY